MPTALYDPEKKKKKHITTDKGGKGGGRKPTSCPLPARLNHEMEPFTILTSYDVLVCTSCRSACLPREVPTHLRSKHRALPAARRAAIIRAVVQSTQGLCQSQRDLAACFRLPAEPVPAIAQLDGPFRDGLKCKACPYVARHLVSIQKHC